MKRILILASAVGFGGFFLAATPATPSWRVVLMSPRIIMFYGGELDEDRRYLVDRAEIWRFQRALSDRAATTGDVLGDRPYVDVALYWFDPIWDLYAADTTLLGTLPLPLPSTQPAPWFPPRPPIRPEDRAHLVQPARLYLGDGSTPPLLDFLSKASPLHLPSPQNRTCVPCGPGMIDPGVAKLHSIGRDGLAVLRSHGVPTTHDGMR